MCDDIRERIQRAVAVPELARNLRGQVRAALDCLAQQDQKFLACDFVEHALETLFHESSPEKKAFLECIDAIRDRLRGAIDLKTVDEKYARAIKLVTTVSEIETGTRVSIGSDGNILRLLEDCCLQRELEEAGLNFLKVRYQPSASTISKQVCHRIAHIVGRPHWNSDDPALKQEARNRGRAASEDEARWQLARILESLQPAKSDP